LQTAEADIGRRDPIGKSTLSSMWVFGPSALSSGDIQEHPGSRPMTLKPMASSAALKSYILFKAITAASAVDELSLQRCRSRFGGVTEQRVETFERYRVDVMGMESRQCRKIRSHRAAKSDPARNRRRVEIHAS
jgi:hypothetical protein